MEDTTLIITARSRPDYLRRVLASWAAVPEHPELRRVIVALGRSDRQDEQLQVIRDSGLRPGVRHDSEAASQVHGEHRALGEAITAAFEDKDCGFVIISSEDVVVSDDVLRYFAWARGYRRLVTCAHNNLGQGWHPDTDDSGADQEAVRLVRGGFSPWCFGINPWGWDAIIERAWDYDATSGPNDMERGWDWQMHRLMQQSGRAATMPDASRALNIGEHGGTYARPEDYPRTVARSFRERRGEVSYRLVP